MLKKKCMLLMFQNMTQILKKVILLKIPNGENLHYLAVKKLSILLRGITSKNVGEYYVWIVFIILEQEKTLVIIKEYVKTLYIFIFFIFTFL